MARHHRSGPTSGLSGLCGRYLARSAGSMQVIYGQPTRDDRQHVKNLVGPTGINANAATASRLGGSTTTLGTLQPRTGMVPGAPPPQLQALINPVAAGCGLHRRGPVACPTLY